MRRCPNLAGVLLGTTFAAGGLALAGDGGDPGGGSAVTSALIDLTGATRVKVVWMRRIGEMPRGTVWTPNTADYELVVFDTAEGRERVLLPGPTRCFQPLITLDGQRVIYHGSDAANIIDWDGTNMKTLLKGRQGQRALCLWRDAKTGIEWVYHNDGKRDLYRCRLDDPSVEELVWDSENRSRANTSFLAIISADGTRMSGTFPTPKCGVANLADGTWRQYSRGCWPNMAPDNSYRFFSLSGDHRYVSMFDGDGSNERRVPVNTMPGVDGKTDAYAPRWIKHPRLIVIAAPLHARGGRSLNESNVYMGRFDEAYTRLEAWAQVSNTKRFESFADAWLGLDAKAAGESERSTAEEAAEPSKTVDREKLLAEAVPAWDARLLERLREELAEGGRPGFLLSSIRQKVTVSAADEKGTLSIKGRGVSLRMSLSRMRIEDRRNLALALVRPGDPDDHCLAAFYLLATGAARAAEAHLQGGGDGAAAVRAVFE